MSNISKEATQITYSRLNKALTKLGFVRKETQDFTAYRETEHGAFIVLPSMSAESTVGEPHLVTVRNTITGKGIASLDQFQTLLFGLHVRPTTSKRTPGTTRRHYAYKKPRKIGSQAYNQPPAEVEKTSRKSGIKKRFWPASGG